ncbi:terpenoid synthase [Nemania abortiva]|nr:terpenoid synthase [Nemania abortiva]
MTSVLCESSIPSLQPPYGLGPSDDLRNNLVNQIRGSRVRISDLKGLLSHWPQEVHPKVQELEQHVEKTLEWILAKPDDELRLRKMKASKIGLFTASWWPYASFEALCALATFSAWLFAWDDEIDSFEFSSLTGDLSSAKAFREGTMHYVRDQLTAKNPENPEAVTNSRLISGFSPVGAALCKSYNNGQINKFLEELEFFIKMCEEEHRTQATGRLPTVEEYMQRRMGSSAVRLCLALSDYATGVAMPADIMSDDSMQIIWHETNIIISVMNDMLSIKKEIAQSQVDSLIPLLFLRFGSAQAALDEATHIASSSIKRLESAEKDILSRYSTATEEIQEQIRMHIKTCKLACTSNLNWSLISGRYKVQSTWTDNGMDMVL